ncbi:leucyl aminopeptidase [Terriglobus roseus]|uniref:Probable cytosol aminopeptidase n=1 Tax=Terriglobus roseus TaxID=392734 RepID=A0A1G7JNE4_9BACT|nr:leucyl aminopeptidase [Terriglobus roseus]SDF26433.1 leucyl aminopeptidase [Terriglobus roseus]
MNASLQFSNAPEFVTSLLTVFAVDNGSAPDAPSISLLTAEQAILAAAAPFLNSGEFKADAGGTLLLHAPAGLKAERLLIVGAGKAAKLSTAELRKAAGTAIRTAKAKSIRDAAIVFPKLNENLDAAEVSRALTEGILLADYDADTYRSQREDRSMQNVVLLGDETSRGALERGFAEGEVFAAAQNFARTLVNEPGNVLTPTELGKRAAAMCEANGLSCEVHSTEKLKELGMGAFLGVAQGSVQPPALIVMRYKPAKAANSNVIGLVGKGITFDTGGISIKPADGMDKMKYDMAGAAAMIGAMQTIAALKPAVEVIGVVCSAENMPSGSAYKPGDVLTAMSGKTIEVMNTDAEGRLVLADGLHYAKTLGATHLINAATLTGACVVALGKLNSGLFSNDDETVALFREAVNTTDETFWQLPCTDDYRELIKSDIADIRNTGMDRWGGAITAAMFLKEFVGETPWIHLDIAGQAWIDESRSYIAKGPSGVAVRSIVEWVRALAQ